MQSKTACAASTNIMADIVVDIKNAVEMYFERDRLSSTFDADVLRCILRARGRIWTRSYPYALSLSWGAAHVREWYELIQKRPPQPLITIKKEMETALLRARCLMLIYARARDTHCHPLGRLPADVCVHLRSAINGSLTLL
jgi:hypothetical protein